MAIAFNSIEIRSSRRLRLLFSSSLGAGAFTDLTHYSVSSADGSGVTPVVVAAFVVPSCPAVVELALGDEIGAGLTYNVSAVGVPNLIGDLTPPGSVRQCRLGGIHVAPAAQTPLDDLVALLYGEDLVWDGVDLVEDANGDLGGLGGVQNVEAALARRLLSDGLAWDPEYGGKCRRYVDGSAAVVGELRGALVRQALKDDRVRSASAALRPPTEDAPQDAEFEITTMLVGDVTAATTVPVSTA